MAGVRFLSRERDFSLICSILMSSGAHTTSCPICTGAPSLTVKYLGCEADYSCPSGAKVKNDGVVPLLFHTPSWCGAQLSVKTENITVMYA